MKTWETIRQQRQDFLKDLGENGKKDLWDNIDHFRDLLMRYHSAMREVQTKLEILNDDLSLQNRRNPIENIYSRVKKPISIAGKLKRLGKPITVNAVREYLNDVAGIRVICSYIDDIYSIAKMLSKQSDVNVISTKDYIKNPKPNGYRSYHMVVEIPVFFSENTENMRVEIQIRTVAMDYWASLEHELRYKNEDKIPLNVSRDLKECAETIASIDKKMLELRKKIEQV